jgi:molecular chaperone DnaK
MHADDDKKKKELVEARNHADTLIYQRKIPEGSWRQSGCGNPQQSRSRFGRLKKAMEGDDVRGIQRLSEELTQASHKVAEAMYKQASEAGAADDAAGGDRA